MLKLLISFISLVHSQTDHHRNVINFYCSVILYEESDMSESVILVSEVTQGGGNWFHENPMHVGHCS